MKYCKKIRGMSTALAFSFAFMVFSFSFAPKAYAAEVQGNVTYGYRQAPIGATEWVNTVSSIGTLPIVNLSAPSRGASNYTYDVYIWLDSSIVFDGPVKMYASYYNSGQGQTPADYVDPSDFTVRYTNSNSQTGYVNSGLDSIETWNVSGSQLGYAIEASWQGSEGKPISALGVYRKTPSNGFYTNSTAYAQQITFPSIRFISSAYSAELETLDKVADEIAAQSDILQAMKGDIVAILQDIYVMTGDILIAQNLLNSYIVQLLPLIQSIDQTTTDIYRLLSSQLAALETAINTSASTIEAAIEAQTAAMIAYLEEMFNTGNEVPDETYQQQQDAENILDEMESLEKPDVETIVPEIDDYSDGGVSGVMSAIFSSNLIVTMMTLSASLAFGAYVLFGKRS